VRSRYRSPTSLEIINLVTLVVLLLTPAYADTFPAQSYLDTLLYDAHQRSYRFLLILELIFTISVIVSDLTRQALSPTAHSHSASDTQTQLNATARVLLGGFYLCAWLAGVYLLSATSRLKVMGVMTGWGVLHFLLFFALVLRFGSHKRSWIPSHVSLSVHLGSNNSNEKLVSGSRTDPTFRSFTHSSSL
jgi:uncharacterized membrane protein